MSIPVAIDDLARTLEDYPVCYLLSTSQGRVKAVTVEPEVEHPGAEGLMVVRGPGRGTCANVAANDVVTLLFPPTKARGHTLLVDGTATASGEDVVVQPQSAVLHRPASNSADPSATAAAGGCGHDFEPVR